MSESLQDQYGRHSSIELGELMSPEEIPHQGQNPRKAQVIAFGLDANYSPEIEEHPEFISVIPEYHNNGVGFRKKYGVFNWPPAEFNLEKMKRIRVTLIYGAPHISSTNYKKSVFESSGSDIQRFCESTI